MNPEVHVLAHVDWQFFSSLSFKSLAVSRETWIKMYFALIRKQAENFGVHFYKILWALRYELGEQTGRPHFHALIAGLPNSAVQTRTCFSFMKIWEELRGGNARVRVYEPALAGVEYVLKGVDEAYKNNGANLYELHKFGKSCDVMLSRSLIYHLQNRKRFGHRDHDGLFDRDLQPRIRSQRRSYSRNRLSRYRVRMESDETRGTDTSGNTLQGGVSTSSGKLKAQTTLSC